MQDNKTNRDKLYTFLTNKGVTGIGANRDEFETIFEDEEKQKKLYDFCVGKGYTGIGKDYDEFAGGFSVQQPANAYEGMKNLAADSVSAVAPIDTVLPTENRNQDIFAGREAMARYADSAQNLRKAEAAYNMNPTAENAEQLDSAAMDFSVMETSRLDAEKEKRTKEELLAERKRLEDAKKEVELRLRTRRGEIASPSGMYQMGMAPVTGNQAAEITDPEMTKLYAAVNSYDNAIRSVDRKLSGEEPGFWEGVADATVRNPGFYTMGLTDMSDARGMLNIAQSGVKEKEDELLADALYSKNAEQQDKDFGFLYRAGNMFGHSVPFMVQTAVTGGFSGASRAGANLAGRLGKKAAEGTIKKKIINAMGTTIDDVIEAGLIANTAGAGGTWANIAERKAGKINIKDGNYVFENGESWLGALYKGEVSSILELYTEKLGGHLEGKLSLTKGLDKIGASRVSNVLLAAKNSDLYKGASTVMRQFGLNGYLPEVLEEEANLVLNSLMVGDNSLSELYNPRTQLDILGGMLLTVGTMQAIPGTIATAGYVKNQYQMNRADSRAADVFGEDWGAIKEALDNATNEKVAGVVSENLRDNVNQNEALLDYYKRMMIMRGYNIGTVKNETAPEIEEAYTDGFSQEPTGANALNAMTGYDMARQEVARALGLAEGDDVDVFLNGRTAEDIAKGDTDVENAVRNYQQQKARMEGIQEKFQQTREQQYEESDRSIQANDNNGMVYATQLKDEPVYITGGNVVLNEDGTIDVDNSSETLYVKFPDGHVEMTSPDKFTEVFTSDRTADLKAAKRAEIDAKWKAEFDAAEVQSVEQEKRDSGVVFNMTDAQGEHRIEILNEGEKMSDILLDGAQTEIPTEELNRWKQEAGIQSAENGVQSADAMADDTTDNVAPTGDNVAPVETAPVELPDVPDFFRLGGRNYEVASRNDDGSVDVIVDGKRETLPAGTDYSTHMPTDKKGDIAFADMPVERTHEYFVQRVTNDKKRAEMIDNNRKKAEAERKKFDKEPDAGLDPDKWEEVNRKWEEGKKAAQAKVDYWKEVAKREAEITRSETREAVDNIKPDVMKETADEFIANQLAGIKITPESFKRETGLSNAEQAQLVGVISNDGVSVERAAEIILENYDSELAGMGFTGDVQDVRDIIISVLSQGNPRSYAKKGREAREAENMDQQRADAEAWAKGAFDMTLDELYLYEETILPRMMRDYEGFDENEYYSNLAENNGYDTTRESESIGRGGELLQGEQLVPAGGTPVVGQRNEGGAVSDDVQGGGQNGVAQEEVPVNEPVGNSEQLSSSEIPNNQSVAEGDAPGQSGVYADNQGNPVDADGKLVVDEVNSIDEITDEDFETPTRNVQLPAIPENVANAIGTNGRPVVIKKNVFEKNGNTHVELEPEDSRNILRSALYNPNLVGSTQPIRRPDYKVAIRTGEQNAVVVLDVYQEKDFVEIVGWRMVNEKGLAKMQRQAEREGGQFLILSPNDGSAAALSALPLGLSSAGEDRNSVSNSQVNTQKSGEIAENGGEIQETAFLETLLDNGDKKITGLNSRGEVATVTIERDGKVVSVDSYDEGVLFEHTEYDGNGKAKSVTRYDKQGNVVGTQVYEDGKAKTPMQKLADRVLDRAEEKRRIPLRERARELEAQVGVKANIIESVDEVADPEARRRIVAGQNVAGWYSKGQVYLYMPNLQDRREIELTYVHEVVAHHGVKKLLRKRFNEFLDGVWNMMSEADRARMLAYVGANENPTLQDMRVAADEYVAELAEKMDLNELERSTWEKIVGWFKELLENIGFENLTKEDIESMLKASYANLRSTEQGAQSKENDFRAKMTFHGSGAKFDRFDHAFMGTGEGAQAFGWGTYVTEVEGVGRTYATTMRDKLISEKHKENAIINKLAKQTLESSNGNKEGALDYLRGLLNESWSDKKRVKAQIKIIETGKFLPETKLKANLYTVEIPDDNGSNYLHWDKPINGEIQERIANGLQSIGFEIEPGMNHLAYSRDGKIAVLNIDAKGEDLYAELSDALGSDKAASLFLNDLGFVGISYPTNATTGGRADGARNYVIFNENDAQIKDWTMFRKKDSERRQEKRRINDAIDTAAGFITVGGKKQATKNRLKKEAERKQLAKEMYSSVLKGDFNDVTLSQIDKFIEDATPANPFGRRISQRLPQRMERALRQGARTNAVDALFSRICESTVPANERFSEAGRREIEERKKELLKGWAIATGNWYTDLKEFTDDTEPIGEGKDSKVYMSKDGNFVIKASKGKPFGKKFRPDIDNIPLFNDVFKNSRYEILGYGEIDGQFVRILKQDFIDFAESTPLTLEERKEYMGKLGFKPLNKDYTAFSNGEIVIADLQKSNIVKDAAGNISVFDADAKLHTKDVGGDYTYPPVEEDLPEQETRFRKVGNTENNSIFASTYKTEDGKDINYTSERTEGYGVQDDGIGNSNNGSRRSILQRQTDTGVPGADSGLDVEKGEFCVVERVFTENGAFNFTSGEKIESADDVAYIFSALEDAAKEHSFVVYVKDGMPTVVELGMGSFNATMVDVPTASLAYSRINPDHVYFVHNHPSGNLICSSQDVAMLRVFEDMSDVPVTGVIINLKTGKYGTFDTERHSVIGEKRVPEKEERLAVHTLDKQIFAPDYDPMAQPLVRGSQDVAQFLNSQRMGDRPKVSFLILSRANRIIGNIHTPFTNITTDVEAVARYINERVIQFGGEIAILYGDFAITSVEGMDFRLLQNAMDRFGKTKLLDVVRVEGNFTRSANDMGLLYEPEAEYKDGRTMFRVTDTDRQALEFKRQHKGSANIVAIDTDALVAELLAQGFTADEIPEIRKMYEKGVLGFYDRKRNTIYLLGKDHGEKENNATFWHENTHKAIGELDVPQEIMDEFYAMPSKRFIDFFEGKAKEFYEPEEYAEELIAYFVEDVQSNGNYDNVTKALETSAENMERLKEIVEPIINYINHGRRTNEGTEGNNRTVVRETIGNGDVETLSEGARTEAEGAGETRFSTRGEGIDNVPTQPLTLMERITNSLLEVSAKNKENLELRASALRTFGRDINRVLSLMKAQREYDKSTVDTLVKLAKMYFQNAQLLGEVTPYEVARIMGVLNRSVGKRDISTEAAKLMDILLDAHTNALAGILDKAEKIKAKKVNAAGVEVMGRLDKYGQKRVDEYRAAKGMTPEKLEEAIFDSDNRLAELEQRVREVLGIPDGDVDLAAREYTGDNDVVNVYMDERARLEGLTLAREYKESIQQVQEEIKDLKAELKQAEEDYRLGNIDGKSLKEFRKSVAEAIMESKAELIEGYHSLIYKFQENTKESSQRAKEFAQAQIDRAREIQHNANSDMEGIPADTQGTHPDNHNNAVMNALRSPFPTFQGMLKKFGEKNAEGKGYLYERFMPQATQASDNEFRGKVAARVMIEAKLKEIYGEKANIARFMKELREYGTTVTYREGNEMKQFDLTKGQMLYIYMVNKMADGQMKLRRMGITDDVVAELMVKLPEEAVQFADWAQNELLKDLRGKYNAVHERVFGAPMAAIENYFPIKIRKEARGEKGDVSEVGQEGKPSTVTGSIIKRTKNATAIDLSADAMQVLMEHIDDMEHWAAFAEFNRDLNVLLNYKHFQNQVKNMTSVRYGSGEEMWKNFKKTAQIVSGTYRPSDSSIDRAVQNIAKGLTRSKINFRVFTAIKQLLSAPAFWTDAGVKELAYCYVNPKGSFKWAKENLPGFAERWQGRTMGNEKLLKSDSDWELWRNEFVEKATRWGMTPNAAIDALTVAQGARAVYMTKFEQFKKAGYTEQRANEKALQAAAEAYNESQQSSEGMYLSPLQVEGTVASAIFSTFKNSNFGYTRKTAQAVANIKRKMRKGYKEETIAFMTKQMVRDGLSEENAKKMAEKVYNRSKYKDVANVAMFGFGLNLLWEAGGMAIYLLLGDDDEEKEKMMKEIALRGSLGLLNGVPFGETMISAAMAVKEGDTKYFRLPELVAVSDIKNLAQVLNYDPVRGANDIVNMLTSMGVGVTPQVLTDILVAFGDVEEFSAEELGMFVARFMNAPQSNLDRLMVDDAMEDSAINADEIMRRYAEYKKSKNAPITQFLYPDAIEQKALERYMKRFNKMLDERLENVVEDNDAYDLFYKGADARMKSGLAKMRQKYLAEDKAEVFEKMDARELVERVLYGSGEINEAYFNLSTAEDEDNAFVLKSVLKELNDLVEEGMQTDEEEQLLRGLKAINNAINKAKRLMKQQPDKAQEHMNNIREMRAEAIKQINNYRKDE